MAFTACKSARKLIAGSGNVSIVTGQQNVLVTSMSQNWKEGTMVYVPASSWYPFTIAHGADTKWKIRNSPTPAGLASTTFYVSDPSTSRAKGGTVMPCGTVSGGDRQFVYVSHVDDAGDPDLNVYLDTLFPEKGVHPYTKDRCYGAVYVSGDFSTAPTFASMLGLRLQAIDGGVPLVDA